ncbi:hypothetical protein OROMI_030352 [Orobanche minor]
MAAQVAREAEARLSVLKLQADFEAERKTNAEFADRQVNMEKESLAAAKRASREAEQLLKANDRLKAEVIEVHKDVDAMMKEAPRQLVATKSRTEAAEKEAGQAAEKAAAAEAEVEKVAEELTANASELERVRAESAANASELEKVRLCWPQRKLRRRKSSPTPSKI